MTATLDHLAGGYLPGDELQLACEVVKTPDSHPEHVTQSVAAVGGPPSEQANLTTQTNRRSPARNPSPPAPATRDATPIGGPLVLADPLLALAADVLDDLERVRIANENRLRQLTFTVDDGGFGLTLDHPDVARLAALIEGLAKAEHDAELQLKRTVRRHPLGPWVKQARGVGEKQAARLLAAIGDPYWNDLHNRPRTVSELWAYCGYHVIRTGHGYHDTQEYVAGSVQPPAGHAALETQAPDASGIQPGSNPDHLTGAAHEATVGVAAARARGQRANWSATAKMRAYLVAASIVKAGGPYREVYDAGRAKYADAVHQVDCKRCGPAGKPALVGSQLSAGHQHARALRLVAKEVLKDLWREAKSLHELHDGQAGPEAHGSGAVVDPTSGSTS